MSSFFSYESKPMQILMYIGDLIILNFIYLLCCIPIFTIGAAQVGLYSAAKVMQDPEDDSSLSAAFFKGFANGFKTVTIAWGIMTLVFIFVALTGITAIQYGAPIWLIAIAVCLAALFQSLVPLFHSRFSCTVKQLIANCWFLLFAHPIRSVFVAITVWLPVGVFLTDAYLFMSLTPIWGTLYFSTAMLFGYSYMKKPFNVLIQHFNETHDTEEASSPTSESAVADQELSEASPAEP